MEEKPVEEVKRGAKCKPANLKPSYQNELSIYQKGMLQKLEEFRMARTHWLAHKDDNQKSSTDVNENLTENNIYKGRCYCLRKLRVKTTYLRTHYKTVRPLRYWTLKKRITDLDLLDAKVEFTRMRRQLKRTESPESCESGRFWTKETIDECERQALAVKGRRAQKRKRRECRENKPSGPCKKAIKKLRASKFRDGVLESCKCDDGREVTLVIKGICLCEKMSLNNLDLNKVCDEYSKRATGVAILPTETKPAGNLDPTAGGDPTKESIPEIKPPPPPPPEEIVDEIQPSKLEKNDSLDIFKKDKARKPEEEDETKVAEEDAEVTEGGYREEKEGEKSDSIEYVKAKRLEDERSERIDYNRSVQTENEKSELFDDERSEKLPSSKEVRRIGFYNDNELKGDGRRRAEPLTDSEITVFRRFSSSSTSGSSLSDTKLCKTPSFENLQRTVRQQAMPQMSKSVKMPQSDSLNNLLISEDKSKLKSKTLPTKTDQIPSVVSRLGGTNSIEVHKKNIAQKNVTDSKEKGENDRTEVRKIKVRLNDTPSYIPNNSIRHSTKPEGKGILMQKKNVLEKVPPHLSIRNQLVKLVREVNTDKEKVQQKPIKKREMKASASGMTRKFSEPQDENSSIVTLYKNKPADKSEMGLTKEERDVMTVQKDLKENVKTEKPAVFQDKKFT